MHGTRTRSDKPQFTGFMVTGSVWKVHLSAMRFAKRNGSLTKKAIVIPWKMRTVQPKTIPLSRGKMPEASRLRKHETALKRKGRKRK